MSMRAWAAVVGIALAAGPGWAVGGVPGAADAPSGDQKVVASGTGGIEGQVFIRPVRPVERRGISNRQAYQARITILNAAGREVATSESDVEGKFRVELPPGTYVLRPESPGLYPRASEQRVTVRRNSVTRVEIIYDSGIR